MAEDKKEPTAADGTPIPTRALPKREVSVKDLANITTPMKHKRLTLKGMIYGDVGSMKTTVAMKILLRVVPENKKILYIDSAEGWSTLMSYPDLKPELEARVLHMPFESQEQLEYLGEVLLRKVAPFDNIGAVLFDEYTQMCDSDLNWIVESRAEQAAESGGYKDPFTPALPDYNAGRIRSNRIIFRFLRLPDTHLIFIGHEKEDVKTRWKLPDIPEKTGKALYQRLHFMYRTEFVTPKEKGGKTYWRMQTVTGNRILAKNRINGVPSEVLHDPRIVVECYENWGNGNNVESRVPEPIKSEETEEPNTDELMDLLK